jgi:hypothetical protein
MPHDIERAVAVRHAKDSARFFEDEGIIYRLRGSSYASIRDE